MLRNDRHAIGSHVQNAVSFELEYYSKSVSEFVRVL
jgi:hypothetical protein